MNYEFFSNGHRIADLPLVVYGVQELAIAIPNRVKYLWYLQSRRISQKPLLYSRKNPSAFRNLLAVCSLKRTNTKHMCRYTKFVMDVRSIRVYEFENIKNVLFLKWRLAGAYWLLVLWLCVRTCSMFCSVATSQWGLVSLRISPTPLICLLVSLLQRLHMPIYVWGNRIY